MSECFGRDLFGDHVDGPATDNDWHKIELRYFCLDLSPVTDRKDDAPAAVQAAIANVVGLGWISGGGGLIQTTSG